MQNIQNKNSPWIVKVIINIMSVYLAIHDCDGCETFIGLFTTFEKANKSTRMFPFTDGYIDIRKIDTDVVYFTSMNACEKSCTDIGERIKCVERCDKINKNGNKIESFDIVEEGTNTTDTIYLNRVINKELLHETNGFNEIDYLSYYDSDDSDNKSESDKYIPHTPYMRFAYEQRSIIEKQNPNISPVDLVKQIGQMWVNLKESKKKL